MPIPGGATDQVAERSLARSRSRPTSARRCYRSTRFGIASSPSRGSRTPRRSSTSLTSRRPAPGTSTTTRSAWPTCSPRARALQRSRDVLHRRRPHPRSGARRARLGAGSLRLPRLRIRLHPELGGVSVLVPRPGAGDAHGLRSQQPRTSTCSATSDATRRRPAQPRRDPARSRSARRCSTWWAGSTICWRPSSAPTDRQKLGAAPRALVCELGAEPGHCRPVGVSADTIVCQHVPATDVNVGPSVRQFIPDPSGVWCADLDVIVTFSAPVPGSALSLGHPRPDAIVPRACVHQSIR